MNILLGAFGIVIILALAYLVSANRAQVRFKPIATLLALQFFCALILLNSGVGQWLIQGVVTVFDALLGFAAAGVNFVFGGLVNVNSFSFFLSVLLPIVFMSALIGLLHYFKILDVIILCVGWLLSKITRRGKLESYNAVASLLLGQSDVFISIKKQLPTLPAHRLYTLCTSAMSTVSAAILAAYMQLIEPKYVVCAVVLNLLGGLMIAALINPYELDATDDILQVQEVRQSFFEMLGEYILDGFKIAIIVAAMLVGFIALIAMANGIFSAIFGVTFQHFLGWIFAPLAFLIGIDWQHASAAGTIMATKLISNEFVAMQELKTLLTQNPATFNAHSVAILSVFLVSFANFGSIGIICGTIKALDAKQANVVARFGFKLLYGASLVSCLSAAIVGLIV